MLETVIKRDGSEEPYMANKLNQWSLWGADKYVDRIDWSSVVMNTVKACPVKMTSEALQEQLIKSCLQHSSSPYNYMAGRLYIALERKRMFGDLIPSVYEMHMRLWELGGMRNLNYSTEEYKAIEEMINHDRDMTLMHFQLRQYLGKYSISNRVTGKNYETPQFICMRMAMALAEDEPEDIRLNEVFQWYEEFSCNRINPPTPNYNNLGTTHNGLASCCLYKVDDNADSLATGDHIAYTMTVMSAGIGGFLNTRSIGEGIRSNTIEHKGKVPYYSSVGKAVLANTQGGRGGACTQYFSIFDPEAETLIMLQNPRTPVASQNRDIHFCVMYNSFFAKKAALHQDIFQFNVNTAPDLMEKFFSADREGFEQLYMKYENDETFVKKYVSAYALVAMFEGQGHEVSTLYTLDIEEVNRHTSFKEPIYSSNLCAEILAPTKGYKHILDVYRTGHEDGEISLCNIGGIVISNIHDDEQYKESAYRVLKMIGKTTMISDYKFPHLEYTAKQRMNAAVGILGLATVLARRGVKYDSPYGLEVIDKLAERHAYWVISASLRLGKELGNAPWMHKTKWPDGWLPIDTYKKTVDKLVPHKLNYDWETLRAEIIENKGIRNSSLISNPPTESSSKAAGAPNGVYPIRALYMKKTDLSLALDWCAVDDDLLGDNYQIAYDIDTNDMIKVYAVIQKYSDQTTSADFYENRIKKPILTEDELVERFLNRVRYGVKSKYYQNSLTVEVAELSDHDEPIIQLNDILINTEDRRSNCNSGGCTL